jgi:DNA ligase (NAD+)
MQTVESLVEVLKKYNAAYRAGTPLVSDAAYDDLVEQLRGLAPDHPYLQAVELEVFEGKNQVRHPIPMLSTEKAYTAEQLSRYLSRVAKEAGGIGIADLVYRVTPKLDGLAGRDDGKVFATRGNGLVGYEISSAFDKGVIPLGGRGQGVGEIVVVKSYFEAHLADVFEHPRNMVVGIISSDKLNPYAQKALQDKVVHFVPYSCLPHWQGGAEALAKTIDDITRQLIDRTDYPTDGLVAEVTNPVVRDHMGATAHHYRWQIAIKSKGETASTTVTGVKWQVGRTGNVTPVLRVTPVNLSGATIRRVTAHHAGMIEKLGIGPGARIEIIRSGEVIPKLEAVHKTAEQVEVPAVCPVCQTALERTNDFLRCPNDRCPAKIEQGISHWFKMLGTADWFGIKTIQKLVQNGFDSLEKIYAMQEDDFRGLGFGPVQSANLFSALTLSRTRPVEDWRFLAAFGISDLGKGDSRKLLDHIPLEQLPKVKARDIANIIGFGEKTSRAIENGLKDVADTFRHMLGLGFNLRRTPLLTESRPTESPIAGKKIVFTGKMQHGERSALQEEARRLGAMVQTAVSAATDYLICGEKVGAAKLAKARELGVKLLAEKEYFDLLAGP